MTTPAVHRAPGDTRHVPLTPGQRGVRDPDLPAAHHRTTTWTDSEGRAA
ncbi:MAG: hypothetical protein ACRDSM_13135 [Pseudonocardiaceae bacterium]